MDLACPLPGKKKILSRPRWLFPPIFPKKNPQNFFKKNVFFVFLKSFLFLIRRYTEKKKFTEKKIFFLVFPPPPFGFGKIFYKWDFFGWG